MIASIHIIVLNWNNAPDTMECLRSLAALDYPDCQVLVVDNGSTDDSVSSIRSAFPEVEILETGANLGYAGGNNAGIRHALSAGADYVLILNNDVVVSPDSITRLVEALHDETTAGIATPLIADAAQPHTIWTMGARIDSRTGMVIRMHAGLPVNDAKAQERFKTDIAPGSAMLVRREVFERVDLMDEAYFLYFEEADWCLATRRAGFNIVVVPSSVMWHKVSATLGKTSPITDYYMARNHLRFISRHWSGTQRLRLSLSSARRQIMTILAYTYRSHQGERILNRNARLLGLRDAVLGRYGPMDRATRVACGLEPE